MENATRAMCSLYGLLGLIPGKVPMQRITQYYFDPSPKGGGVCSLISHIRVCEHEWSKPGECLEYGLACLQIQIILGHLLGCEDHKCELCNVLCTNTCDDPRCDRYSHKPNIPSWFFIIEFFFVTQWGQRGRGRITSAASVYIAASSLRNVQMLIHIHWQLDR